MGPVIVRVGPALELRHDNRTSRAESAFAMLWRTQTGSIPPLARLRSTASAKRIAVRAEAPSG